ncbi:hypothetical protein LINPERPRIM_LOCUS40998 [Linum perenne]
MSEPGKAAGNLIMATPDSLRSRIGRIIASLTKFGLDSAVDVSPKASTGLKSTYGIVQQRMRDHPSTSLLLKLKTKHEDSMAGSEAEQGEKQMMSLQSSSNETSSAISVPLANLKEAPIDKHNVEDSASAETGKKRIFIRSRL